MEGAFGCCVFASVLFSTTVVVKRTAEKLSDDEGSERGRSHFSFSPFLLSGPFLHGFSPALLCTRKDGSPSSTPSPSRRVVTERRRAKANASYSPTTKDKRRERVLYSVICKQTM